MKRLLLLLHVSRRSTTHSVAHKSVFDLVVWVQSLLCLSESPVSLCLNVESGLE